VNAKSSLFYSLFLVVKRMFGSKKWRLDKRSSRFASVKMTKKTNTAPMTAVKIEELRTASVVVPLIAFTQHCTAQGSGTAGVQSDVLQSVSEACMPTACDMDPVEINPLSRVSRMTASNDITNFFIPQVNHKRENL